MVPGGASEQGASSTWGNDIHGGHEPRRRRRGAIVAAASLAVMALVAAGCSSGRDGAGATESPTETTTAAAATFGSLPSPCGPGDATGATDVGVTEDSVTIGYGDDAGFAALPGAGHEMSDAVKALITWCNDQGGINGRQVKGNYYDAKITEVANAMTAACQGGVFMMVGEGYVFDGGQEEARLGCGLPAIPAYGTSSAFSNGALTYQPSPNPIDRAATNLARPGTPRPTRTRPPRWRVIAATLGASTDTADKQKAAWPKVGRHVPAVRPAVQHRGEADWKPFVQHLKDCGAEAVRSSAPPTRRSRTSCEAADQLDYHPDWLVRRQLLRPVLRGVEHQRLGR